MILGLKALKALVADGTPQIDEGTLRMMLKKGKNVSVMKHHYLQGWVGMPADAVDALIIVRGAVSHTNIEHLIREFRDNVFNKNRHVDCSWTYVPADEVSAEAIVISDPEPPLTFNWKTGTATVSKRFLSDFIRKLPGIHGEPKIKKVKLI